jgi:hypothetical protein
MMIGTAVVAGGMSAAKTVAVAATLTAQAAIAFRAAPIGDKPSHTVELDPFSIAISCFAPKLCRAKFPT